MKLKRRRRTEADIAHRDVKVKQKLWDRWKANVRYMARQKKGKRPITRRPPSHMSSTTSLPDPPAETAVSPTPLSTSVSRDPSSPTQELSPRRRVEQQTVSASPNHLSDPNHNTASTSTDPETLSFAPSSPTYPSPPTYQRSKRLIVISITSYHLWHPRRLRLYTLLRLPTRPPPYPTYLLITQLMLLLTIRLFSHTWLISQALLHP
jgi:hypothetical protein